MVKGIRGDFENVSEQLVLLHCKGLRQDSDDDGL